MIILNKISRPTVTQDLEGFNHLENFLLSTVATILIVRFYLKITGYPQIGGGGIHVAHMLWGGFLLGISLLLVLLLLDRKIRKISAVLGGIGFGLFIDELGKFITSDNNYFFRPTIALIYVIVVLLYLALILVKKYTTISSREYVSNALDIFRDSIINGSTPENENQIKYYLSKAEGKISFEALNSIFLSRNVFKSDKQSSLYILRQKIIGFLNKITNSKLFRRLVLIYIGFQAVGTVILFVIIIFFFTSKEFSRELINSYKSPLSFTSVGLFFSSLIAGILALIGFITFPFSRIRAYTLFRSYLLMSIFIVQFFLFLQNQLGAIVGLFGNIIGLMAINVLVKQNEIKKRP